MAGTFLRLEKTTVLAWLDEVKDPEIPVLSLVDLGVITDIQIDGDRVKVTLTPTFVGCPAMDFMKAEVTNVLTRHGVSKPEVNMSFKDPWNSDRISEKGRAALREFGLAPPPHMRHVFSDLSILNHVECPRCNGTNTEMRSPFGSTLCRSIHYCKDCRESFEQFKPLGEVSHQ